MEELNNILFFTFAGLLICGWFSSILQMTLLSIISFGVGFGSCYLTKTSTLNTLKKGQTKILYTGEAA
jgi:hypothetical protein